MVRLLVCLAGSLLLGACWLPGQNIITTVAGSGWVFRGEGALARNAALGSLKAVVVDSSGNVYASDFENNLVVKISPTTGLLTVVAGNALQDFSGDGGPAINASFCTLAGLALDAVGNLYIADNCNHRVRRVSPGGVITTVAGNENYGFSGDGGPATGTSLWYPYGLAIDRVGNLYIADGSNQRIRKVSPSGIITTLAGNGTAGFSGDNGPATAAALNYPTDLAVDAAGNVYVVENYNRRVRRIDTAGRITTVAGGGEAVPGDGGPATAAALYPQGVTVDSAGNLYITDGGSYAVRKVTPNGIISTVAGNGHRGLAGADGTAATATPLYDPAGVAIDAAGNLYLTDDRYLRKIGGGAITRLAGNGLFKFGGDGGPARAAYMSEPSGIAVAASSGDIYVADQVNHRIRKVSAASGIITTVAGNGVGDFTGESGPATQLSLREPMAVALDAAGNLYIADMANDRIRKVTPSGTMTTYAGGGYTWPGVDGGPATAANLCCPSGLAFDTAGNLYVSQVWRNRVLKITPSGILSAVAGTGTDGFAGDGAAATAALLNYPLGMALDAAGNLYIADSGNNRIRKVTPGGVISTIAGTGEAGASGDGGPATAAQFSEPVALLLDSGGNTYVADRQNQRIRKIGIDGRITTVAGTGEYGFDGDGGPATAAVLGGPSGVALDAAGNLYIVDLKNDRIREVLAANPRLSPQTASLSFKVKSGTRSVPQEVKLDSSLPGLAWRASARTSDGANWLSVSPGTGQTSTTLAIAADATALRPGAYQGAIDIASPGAQPPQQSISVTLTVEEGLAPLPVPASLQPESLDFRVVAGSAAAAQTLELSTAGGWTAAASATAGNWPAVTPASGTGPARLSVSVNATGLAPGSYSGAVTVTALQSNYTVSARVTLIVVPAEGVLLLSQTAMAFNAVEAGGAEPPQTFAVLNAGSGDIDWSAVATVPWLSVSPASGRSAAGGDQPQQVTVSVDATGRPAGLYNGFIRISSAGANNSPQLLRIDLQVLPRGTPLPAYVRPTGLIFFARAGGASPGSQDVVVSSTDSAPVEFQTYVFDGAWLRRIPDSGTLVTSAPARITAQPRLGTLAAGEYRATLSVYTRNDGQVQPVRVLFVVLPSSGSVATALARQDPAADPACTPSKLYLQFATLFSSFTAVAGWPTVVMVQARDSCGAPVVGGRVSLSFSSGDPPLTLTDLKNGDYLGSWRPGSASSTVQVAAKGAWRGLDAQATSVARVNANPSPKGLLSQGGILLGAGFQRGPVAPGSIVSLFGQGFGRNDNFASAVPLPTSLAGVRVLVAGKEAPLFYVGAGQVNAQIPAELAADRQLQIQVETDGVGSVPEPLETVAGRPGIFTLGPAWGQQGAVLVSNTDALAAKAGSVPDRNARPAHPGEYISIYCTGLGATNPVVPSGRPGPAAEPLARVKTPVSVTIGGRGAEVVYAGIAPNFVGVYQVDARVPAGVAPGDAVAVVITQGGAASNTATVAIGP